MYPRGDWVSYAPEVNSELGSEQSWTLAGRIVPKRAQGAKG
jgi:hypothetical protein